MSCKSGTGFVQYQIPTPIKTLFYSKPESGVSVTEMIIYDLLLFNILFRYNIRYNNSGELIVHTSLLLLAAFYFRRQKLSFRAHMVRETGARKWSRFIAPVSGACVMGISIT